MRTENSFVSTVLPTAVGRTFLGMLARMLLIAWYHLGIKCESFDVMAASGFAPEDTDD